MSGILSSRTLRSALLLLEHFPSSCLTNLQNWTNKGYVTGQSGHREKLVKWAVDQYNQAGAQGNAISLHRHISR